MRFIFGKTYLQQHLLRQIEHKKWKNWQILVTRKKPLQTLLSSILYAFYSYSAYLFYSFIDNEQMAPLVYMLYNPEKWDASMIQINELDCAAT